MEKKYILITSDHNGVKLKNKILKKFKKKFNLIDIGPNNILHKVDYTDFAKLYSILGNFTQLYKSIHSDRNIYNIFTQLYNNKIYKH